MAFWYSSLNGLRHKWWKFIQVEVGNLHSLYVKGIEFIVIKTCLQKNTPDPDEVTGEQTIKHLRRSNTSSIQTIPETWKGGNSSQLILWDY